MTQHRALEACAAGLRIRIWTSFFFSFFFVPGQIFPFFATIFFLMLLLIWPQTPAKAHVSPIPALTLNFRRIWANLVIKTEVLVRDGGSLASKPLFFSQFLAFSFFPPPIFWLSGLQILFKIWKYEKKDLIRSPGAQQTSTDIKTNSFIFRSNNKSNTKFCYPPVVERGKAIFADPLQLFF